MGASTRAPEPRRTEPDRQSQQASEQISEAEIDAVMLAALREAKVSPEFIDGYQKTSLLCDRGARAAPLRRGAGGVGRRRGRGSPAGQGEATMAPVIPFSADRFRLRLTLEGPLPMLGEGRSPRPFDHYLAELVRDEDARVVAFMDVYFLRTEAAGVLYVRTAAALGSEYLVHVCLEALDADGHVQASIERAFDDAMTDVFVLASPRGLARCRCSRGPCRRRVLIRRDPGSACSVGRRIRTDAPRLPSR